MLGNKQEWPLSTGSRTEGTGWHCVCVWIVSHSHLCFSHTVKRTKLKTCAWPGSAVCPPLGAHQASEHARQMPFFSQATLWALLYPVLSPNITLLHNTWRSALTEHHSFTQHMTQCFHQTSLFYTTHDAVLSPNITLLHNTWRGEESQVSITDISQGSECRLLFLQLLL